VVIKSSREDNNNTASEDLSTYQLVEPGDLAINKMKAWQGSAAISSHRGIVSPAYFVFEARHKEHGRYMHYLFRSSPYVAAYARISKGVRPNQWDLDPQQHSRLPVIVPPADQQRRIADYLDAQTSKIDALIGKQERLIETLTERRQAVISRAVAKGLDANVPMKDSGIEWLGNVPASWRVLKLGFVTDVLTGFPFKSDQYSTNQADTRLLRGVNVNPGTFVWNDVVFWPRDDTASHSLYALRSGDLVLGLDRPIVAAGTRLAKITAVDLPALLLQRVARIRPVGGADADFLAYLLGGPEFRAYLEPIFTGVSVPHMSPDQLSSYRVAVPSTEEQGDIVAFLDRETSRIDALSAKAREMIDVLKERRQALISAAVTGKIDVRGLA
jgi:type I restriction enzyme S subunit